MRKYSKRVRTTTAVVSAVVAIAFAIGFFVLRPMAVSALVNEVFLFAILVIITPSAVLHYLNQRWLDAIEDQMPILVRGVSESQETGLTFVKAFDKVVEDKLVRHPLADEVKKLSVQMSWGLSFEDALKHFRERIDSPIVTRFCALVLEASRSGGQIRKVFSATSGFMEEMRDMDRETSSQMKPYLIIIYAAFLASLITSVVLLNAFFAPLEGYSHILSPVQIIGVKEFKDFFYRTMLVSGLLGGLMAGKIGERRVWGGLKHSVVMIVVGYVVFFIMIPPNWMVK